MALLQPTLSTQLNTQVQNASTEAPARAALALAWKNYFAGASSNGIPILAPALTAAQSAMATGLTGMSAPGAGAAALQAGILAWWGILVATPAAAFTGATLVVLPPLTAGIAAALAPVFVANKTLTKAQALDAVATVLHANGGLGGSATFPGPTVAPIL